MWLCLVTYLVVNELVRFVVYVVRYEMMFFSSSFLSSVIIFVSKQLVL